MNEEDKLGNIEVPGLPTQCMCICCVLCPLFQESLSYYEGEVKRLELREATLSQEKMTLQSSLDRVRTEATKKTDSQAQLTQQLTVLQQQLADKSQSLAQLSGQLTNVNREKEKKSLVISQLSNFNFF